MTRTKFAARALIAGIAASSLGVLAASPASAHTNNIYTYFDDSAVGQGFATMDRTDGAVTSLPIGATDGVDTMVGAEVFDEVGTAIGVTFLQEEYNNYFVIGWDHSTGAEDTPISATVAVTGFRGIEDISGLDTLADGTTITYVEYQRDEGPTEFPTVVDYAAIASVDRATGVLTPMVDLTALIFEDEFSVYSIATDPIGGGTYAFLRQSVTEASYAMAISPATGLHDSPIEFGGVGFEDGTFAGADFDHDGTLYFIFMNDVVGELELSTVGAPSTWPTAERNYVADAASNFPTTSPLSTLALTIEYTEVPEPTLAATGSDGLAAVWLAAAGVAVLAGAVTVVTVRRRGCRAVV